MPPTEFYLADNGSLFKKNSISQTDTPFFTYFPLSDEEIKQLKNLLNNNLRRKSQGGSTGDQATEPTTGIGARTDTESITFGGDYLQT